MIDVLALSWESLNACEPIQNSKELEKLKKEKYIAN